MAVRENPLRAIVLVAGVIAACRRSSKPELSAVPDERADAPSDARKPAPIVRAIAAGALTSCASYESGAVRCWGWNFREDVTVDEARWLAPHVVAGARDGGSPALALGGDHGCTSFAARLACWGWNRVGEVGDGTDVSRLVPVELPDLVAVSAVSLGRYFTCAIADRGRVWCWGDNRHGQVGCDAGLSCPSPKKRPVGAAMKPTEILGAAGATSIAAGAEHVCALLAAGDVVCWGSNADGQIDASDVTGYFTEPQTIGAIRDARSLAAGEGHTCAVSSTGAVQCWGRNHAAGQLGQGASPSDAGIKRLKSAPVVVPGLSGVTQLAAGLDHTCALKEGGTVACWGANARGQLGDGTRDDRPSPTEVFGLTKVRAIAAGALHTCALGDDGKVTCWGWNQEGQLGDGTKIDRARPTLVVGL